MKREIIVLVGLVIALMVFAGCKSNKPTQSREGQRAHKRPTVEQLFEKMDSNKDGKLSEKEVKGPLANDFDKIDLDEDGFLSKEEIEKAPKPNNNNNNNRMEQNRPEF